MSSPKNAHQENMNEVQDIYHHMEKRSEETGTVYTDDDYKNIPINMKLCLKWSSIALSSLSERLEQMMIE